MKTKFDIGQQVWVIEDSWPVQVVVKAIAIEKAQLDDSTYVEYQLSQGRETLVHLEGNVFADPRHLMDAIQKRIEDAEANHG